MKAVYRRMTEKDVPQVLTIETKLFPDPWSRATFLLEIENTIYSYPYVLAKNDQIIGYCNCWYYFKELHIGNFAIKKEFQGQGYGNLLMERILETFPEDDTAFLEVGISNSAAIALYSKFGFKPLSTRKSYYSNGEDAIVMSKRFSMQN